MAKRSSSEPKTVAPPAEERFVQLMLVAADFVKSCGGIAQARKVLTDAGTFIEQAGGVASAEKALGVLDSLRDKIAGDRSSEI